MKQIVQRLTGIIGRFVASAVNTLRNLVTFCAVGRKKWMVTAQNDACRYPMVARVLVGFKYVN